MPDLEEYRQTDQEQARTSDLLRLLPEGGRSVLDIGARDGHFSRLLTEYFETVTALDLVKPRFVHPGVVPVAGDITKLPFPDASFDCVFCCEVLEHIPDLGKACREIIRVTRRSAVIGVPFRQDIRYGRTTCRACGKSNPPWGHVNSFTEERLCELFPGMTAVATSFVGTNNIATNPVSTFLMDLAGNPYGTYDQDEPCIYCGARPSGSPAPRALWQKVCSAVGERLRLAQSPFLKPHGNWIHMVFSKPR